MLETIGRIGTTIAVGLYTIATLPMMIYYHFSKAIDVAVSVEKYDYASDDDFKLEFVGIKKLKPNVYELFIDTNQRCFDITTGGDYGLDDEHDYEAIYLGKYCQYAIKFTNVKTLWTFISREKEQATIVVYTDIQTNCIYKGNERVYESERY
jgi:hypothetical protein